MLKLRWILISVLLFVVSVAAIRSRHGIDTSLRVAERAATGNQSDFVIDRATEQRIIAFCSACHVMPVASSFSRDAWHEEVMQGYLFYAKSGRTDLDPPPPAAAITYFRRLAANNLELPATPDAKRSAITFREETIPLDSTSPIPHAVAHVKWLPPTDMAAGQLIASDMRLGTIYGVTISRGRLARTELGRFGHPCHVEPSDLDGDGIRDFVIADLGSFDPDDHDRGRVLWAPLKPQGKRKPVVLASGMGRIADVRPADFDRDGDQDLVVAEFGWQRTGGIHLLWNTGVVNGEPRFQAERIYGRTGAIHVPAFDFDGDQRLDVVALISQEHERVELLLNRGSMPWEVRTLWSAPDPAFGMSGMELVDFDKDGDMDILLTNGDTFDSKTVKPSHGIQWLRNDGDLNFSHHRIADLSGVYRAVPADFDGDGDLDIVACVWLPRQSIYTGTDIDAMSALVVFEQTKPQEFERHTLQHGHPCFASVDVGDFDADGDLDIAVGWFLMSLNQSTNWLSVWWNEGPTKLARSAAE